MIFTFNCTLPTLRWSHAVLHDHDKLHKSIPLYLWYVEFHQAFPICGNSVIHRYHHPGIHHWPLNIDVGSMWGITVFPSIPQAPLMGSCSRPVCWYTEEYFQALGGEFKYHKECQEISGMFNTFLPQIHILKDLNHAFRRFATHCK